MPLKDLLDMLEYENISSTIELYQVEQSKKATN